MFGRDHTDRNFGKTSCTMSTGSGHHIICSASKADREHLNPHPHHNVVAPHMTPNTITDVASSFGSPSPGLAKDRIDGRGERYISSVVKNNNNSVDAHTVYSGRLGSNNNNYGDGRAVQTSRTGNNNISDYYGDARAVQTSRTGYMNNVVYNNDKSGYVSSHVGNRQGGDGGGRHFSHIW
jgi:hypothetical protein